MNLRYGTHYKTFITNLNAAVKKADKDVQDMDLTSKGYQLVHGF